MTPLPDQVGGQPATELGGTAGDGGLDPMRLLLPTALLLVVLAVVLRILHTACLQH